MLLGTNLILIILAVLVMEEVLVIGCHYQHNYKVEGLVYLQRVPIYLQGFYITVEMEEQVRLRLRELVIFYQEGVEVLEMLEMPQHV